MTPTSLKGLLADTNFFITLAQKKDKNIDKEIIAFLKKHNLEKENIYFSAITCLELFTNKDCDTRKKYKDDLADLEIVDIDEEIAMNASNISNSIQYFRNGKKVPIPDAIIAATAFAKKLRIITTDINDFCPPLFSIKHSYTYVENQDFLAIYIVEPNYKAVKEFSKNCKGFALKTSTYEGYRANTHNSIPAKEDSSTTSTMDSVDKLIEAIEKMKKKD